MAGGRTQGGVLQVGFVISGGLETVIGAVPTSPDVKVQEMFAVPPATAVTNPVVDTVATLVVSEAHWEH